MVTMVNKKTLPQFITEACELHKNEQGDPKYRYHLIDEGTGSYIKVPILCPIEEHGVFWQTKYSHLKGRGCPKCAGNYNYTTKEFIKLAKLVHGDKYDYSKVVYVNSRTKVIIICPIHGEFEQRPNDHLKKCGCPKCTASKGESKIANYLDSKKISYSREYKLDGYNYRYDFYLPGYNLLIEYHGIQHYTQNKHWNNKKTHNKRIRNDKAKVELAKRNGIDLLVISYLEIEQIEEILKYELIDKVIDTKIVDISHVYGLYCNIDKKERRRYMRYHNILYSYLTDDDIVNVISKYSYIKDKYQEILELLTDTVEPYKDKFIRLLAIEHKILIKKEKL